MRKNPDAATDEERARLESIGRFHTGEFINRIRPGSLVMRLPDSELGAVPTFLYGGVNGAVGLVASLPNELYDMLAALQEGLKKVSSVTRNCNQALPCRVCMQRKEYSMCRCPVCYGPCASDMQCALDAVAFGRWSASVITLWNPYI